MVSRPCARSRASATRPARAGECARRTSSHEDTGRRPSPCRRCRRRRRTRRARGLPTRAAARFPGRSSASCAVDVGLVGELLRQEHVGRSGRQAPRHFAMLPRKPPSVRLTGTIDAPKLEMIDIRSLLIQSGMKIVTGWPQRAADGRQWKCPCCRWSPRQSDRRAAGARPGRPPPRMYSAIRSLMLPVRLSDSSFA